MINSTYIECLCGSTEHTLRFNVDKDHNPPSIYITVFLNRPEQWYRRVLTGIRYILGYKSKYGHFDEIILQSKDAKTLIRLCEQVIPAHESHFYTSEIDGKFSNVVYLNESGVICCMVLSHPQTIPEVKKWFASLDYTYIGVYK